MRDVRGPSAFLGAFLIVALIVGPGLAEGACNAAAMYDLVKGLVLLKEPATSQAFDDMMSGLGPTKDEHVWKCESEEGSFLVVFLEAKRWALLDYTPGKVERVPDALLTALAARSHVEMAGPRAVRFKIDGPDPSAVALHSSAEVVESITFSLGGGVHEGTHCTIKLGNAPARKQQSQGR